MSWSSSRSWLAVVLVGLTVLGITGIPSPNPSRADEDDPGPVVSLVARDLARPVGITFGRGPLGPALFFTEVPEPGVAMGANGVKGIDIRSGWMGQLSRGEPEPTNIVQARDGTLYWTCRSAGVILRRLRDGTTGPLLSDLASPTGIALHPRGRFLYFTEVPTPGVGGSSGGENRVSQLDLATGEVAEIDFGDPEPNDIAAASNGDLYWTCSSAGVIVRYDAAKGSAGVILGDLARPTGIDLGPFEQNLFFTEVPTPGVSGEKGGMNRVSVLNLWRMETRLIHEGDPEPTDVTVGRDGTVYWTCTSAGVILRARLR